MKSLNQVICGDVLKNLKTLPANSVDTVITSPPYSLETWNGVCGITGLPDRLG